MKKWCCILFFIIAATSSFSQHVPDSIRDNPKVKIYLETGIEKKGYLIHDTDTEVKIWTNEVGFLKIDKLLISRIEYLSEDKVISENENPADFSHYYALSNSAFSPGKGQMYIRLPYSICGVLDYGVTDDLSFGINAYYIMAMSANLRYKIDFSPRSKLGLSIGTYYTYLIRPVNNPALFSARAAYTIGDAENNFTLGAAFLTNFSRAEVGVISISGIKKVSERSSVVTDIFVAPDLRSLNIDLNYAGAGFIGLRFKTRKNRTWDIGVVNMIFENSYYNLNGIYSLDRLYIPIPYFQYAYKL